MLSKKIALTVLGTILCYNFLFAQSQQKVTIKEATVFLNGAELFSTGKVNLQAGETEILFTNIAGNVNRQSLTVGATNNVVVQSATFQNNYLQDDNLSPRAKEIKDSIELLNDKKQGINNKKATIDEQIAIIKQNRQVAGSNTGLSVTELQKMLDLVNSRMTALLNDRDELQDDVKKYDERLTRLNQQLNEEKRKGFQPGGQLLVKFYTQRATNSDITISYVVPSAGWTPSYDLRVEDVDNPVKLFYKAQVFQNSGVAWNDVKLILSTGNPSEGAEAPTLNPWYLRFYAPRPIAYRNQAYNNGSYAPYEKSAKEETIELQAEATADMPQDASLGNYVQVNNSGINTTFDIELPYTIPSDGQQHNVAIKDYKLPATYRYYTVPKLDKDAFLQAQITDWEDLNLLPAQTNIFYEGTYVGQGYIDMRSVKDTLNISLGRDKKIIVRRERDKELRKSQTLGNNIKESFSYTICIRNTRNKPIDIVVMDQFPVSNDNDIDISDRTYDGASYNEQTGAITWKMELKPNEKKDLKFGYKVKYPKGKTINL